MKYTVMNQRCLIESVDERPRLIHRFLISNQYNLVRLRFRRGMHTRWGSSHPLPCIRQFVDDPCRLLCIDVTQHHFLSTESRLSSSRGARPLPWLLRAASQADSQY
jgi:hypothetical protein